MPKVTLMGSIRAYCGGIGTVEVEGGSVRAAVASLEKSYPALKGWVVDEQGALRRHVKLFAAASLSRSMQTSIRAMSSTSSPPFPEDENMTELLVGTKKGLIVLRGTRGGRLDVAARAFPGEVVEYATRDPRSGRYLASVTTGQFGPHLFFSENAATGWQQAEGPSFPSEAKAAVERIWVIQPGVADNELWCGVAPAALFHSTDGGRSWSLVQGLWDIPDPPRMAAGLRRPRAPLDLPLARRPEASRRRHLLGGRVAHRGRRQELALRRQGARAALSAGGGAGHTHMHCVHNMHRAPKEPHTIYMQFHGGVYRSDDAGESWIDIGTDRGLPSDFGFPLVIDPADPGRAFVIPLAADLRSRHPRRQGARLRDPRPGLDVGRALEEGLPQSQAYLTVLRQAFCTDGLSPLGLYFGATSGDVFGSADGGRTWATVATRLPPVTSVRCA